jgi:hypothetical protein
MLISEDCMSPPAAAVVVWAKAEEMNTGKLHKKEQIQKRFCPRGQSRTAKPTKAGSGLL